MIHDNNQQVPPIPPIPPIPPRQIRRPGMSPGMKILLLGLQCGLLMFGALAIWIMSYSRDKRNKDVAEEIASEWGGPVFIKGPMATEHLDSAEWIQPSTFTCAADVETQSLHRNIYEAEVFNTNIRIAGSFSKDSLIAFGDTIFLELEIDTRQVSRLSELKIGGQSINWSRSSDFLFVRIDVSDMPEVIDFSTDIDVRGSGALFIMQVGQESVVTIDGEAPNPSFKGRNLPDERNLRGNRFSARWEGEGVADNVDSTDESQFVGANFLIGVDRYQKVSRSLKYAFLIILLTYISVLFTEIIMKRDIPLLNYFLIGIALILFYSLLLSFAEHLSFGISYLIAAIMTVGLIAGYMWKMLSSAKVGLLIGGILTAMYASCFILLSISNFALLLGSLILFVALAAMMYGSLQVKR